MQIRKSITLDEEIADELDEIAKELNEKKSHIIEKALTYYFDFIDLQLSKKRLAEYEKGNDKLIDAEKIWKELGI